MQKFNCMQRKVPVSTTQHCCLAVNTKFCMCINQVLGFDEGMILRKIAHWNSLENKNRLGHLQD